MQLDTALGGLAAHTRSRRDLDLHESRDRGEIVPGDKRPHTAVGSYMSVQSSSARGGPNGAKAHARRTLANFPFPAQTL